MREVPEVSLDTQLVHSPCSSVARGSAPSPCCLQWVDTSSGVGPRGAAELSQCAGPFTPAKCVDHKAPISVLCCDVSLSLSLSAPLRQHNKSRHVPTRHQQPDQAYEHAPRPEGEDQRERKRGGKPRKKKKKIPSVTQAASVSEHAPLLLLTLSTRGVAVRGCTRTATACDTVKAGFLTKAELGKSKKRTLK